MQLHPRLLLAALITLTTIAPPHPAGAAPVVEYLYIEANEGGSSGGHAALRLDDAVYHFQHQAPGVIRLHRDGADHFAGHYTGLQNRTIHASRIATSAETYALLRDYFAQAYFVQQKQFEILAAREDDVRLLQGLRDQSRRPAPAGGDHFGIRGAGFFYATIPPARGAFFSPASSASGPDHGASSDDADGGIERLRDRVRETYGPDAIQQRVTELYAELLALRPPAGGDQPAPLAEDVYPHAAPTFSQRYRDLLSGLVALQVLETAPPLRSGTYRTPAGEDFRLTADEQRNLQAFAADSVRDLAPLLRSQRPDWGVALLIGMARLRALDATARCGSFVFLDSFPPDAEVIPRADLERNAQALPELLGTARAELHGARNALLADPTVSEVTFTQLEAAANRVLELSNAAAGDSTLRVHSGFLIPSREALVDELIAPDLTTAELDGAIDSAARQRDEYRARLDQFYAYRLITKNCVSEIFRYIDTALAPTDAHVTETSTARLGGHIAPGAALSFIPFVSADAVRRTYHVTETETLPSYRTRTLDGMYAREDDLFVFLRESNAVTSTLYRRNPRDSYFVFFTDDTVATRPLFGAVNLLAGVGAGAVGVALWPFDGGDLLKRGLKGALFSLPELAFFNIRKGTFDYVAGS